MSSVDSTGRSISGADPLLIFDLDGTLLHVNSFPLWAGYMLVGKWKGLTPAERLLLSSRTLIALLKRKLLKEHHTITKRRLQKLWSEASAKDDTKEALHRLLSQLKKTVRLSMKELLADVANNNISAIMATAAAAEYAVPLGNALGFTHVIASPAYSDFNIAENSGTHKRDNVLAHIAQYGWQHKQRIFFTDHEDDLPLIQASSLVCWFGSSNKLEALKAQAHGVEFIDCLDNSGAELLAIVKKAYGADAPVNA